MNLRSNSVEFFRKEVLRVMTQNLHKKVRVCPQCHSTFSVKKSQVKFFCSPSCYGKYHRLPGQVRKLMKEVKD